MDAAAAPALGAGGADALEILESLMASLASTDPAELADEELARRLRVLERVDAIEAAVRGRLLEAFDARDGHVADGQRTARTWLVHSTRVTRGQAAEHKAVQVLARRHPVLADALAEGSVLTKSVALQVARWTRRIPAEFRGPAEEIVVAAARAGADVRALARSARRSGPGPCRRTQTMTRPWTGVCPGDHLGRGGGPARGPDPECAAMVQAVLDALSAPAGGGDLRTRPQRYHDALAEAMQRLLASGLLPAAGRAAGQGPGPHDLRGPVRAGRGLRAAGGVDRGVPGAVGRPAGRRVGEHRGRRRVAEGDAARRVACDAMLVPVVTGDMDLGAVEELIGLCVPYHRLRPPPARPHPPPAPPGDGTPGTPGRRRRQPRQPPAAPARPVVPAGLTGGAAAQAGQAALVTAVLAMLEHQILATVLQIVSGPGGVASFLRRNLLGKGLNGPSLPLDVGQTDDIPVHLRRLVALRDQTCQFPGGCDQPAAVRAAPCGAPPGRRPDQPGGPEELLLVAPSRGAARDGLAAHRPPGRDQRGQQPGRQDHPQPRPPGG